MEDRRYIVEAQYTGGKSRDWISGLSQGEVGLVLDRIEDEKPVHVKVMAELTADEVAAMRLEQCEFGFSISAARGAT